MEMRNVRLVRQSKGQLIIDLVNASVKFSTINSRCLIRLSCRLMQGKPIDRYRIDFLSLERPQKLKSQLEFINKMNLNEIFGSMFS